MTNSGLFLTTTAFSGLSASAQQEVLLAIGIQGVSQTAILGDTKKVDAAPTIVDGPAELTSAFVRRLTDKLGEKTLSALKAIALTNSTKFLMSQIIAETFEVEDPIGMRNVLSALTRRTRKVLNDDSADLIWWARKQSDGTSTSQTDYVGEIAPLTLQSLKAHFGV